jgi:protein-L-isoaspartate(D-aspartate) O-methyltransferase
MRKILLILAIPALLAALPADREQAAREQMILSVRNLAAVSGLPDRGRLSPAVLAALRNVPRHLFVPHELRDVAYENRPLPIGDGQTISQPFIVALMTDLLKPRPDHVVLEVGTGSGYQAAVLAGLVKRIHSIEIVAPLARQAAERLRTLGYANVVVRHGDGYAGWPEHAPFDAIIVTAGADHVPAPLVAQLKPGGRMVIPVGPSPGDLQLLVIEKARDGSIRRRAVLPVSFVPLTRRPPS